MKRQVSSLPNFSSTHKSKSIQKSRIQSSLEMAFQPHDRPAGRHRRDCRFGFHKQIKEILHSEQGFTLIEVIVTMVIVTVASLAVFTFLNGVVLKSGESLSLVRDLAEIQQPIEEMTAIYQDYLLAAGTEDNSTGSWTDCKESFQQVKTTYEESFENLTITISEAGGAIGSTGFEIRQVTATKGQNSLSVFFSE